MEECVLDGEVCDECRSVGWMEEFEMNGGVFDEWRSV